MGTTMGTFFVALIVQLIVQPNIGVFNFIICFLSGALWSIGQLGQYHAYSIMGVSRAMPISTGFQLIGNTAVGVLIFHEWSAPIQLIVGVLAISIIIIGIRITSIENRKRKNRKAFRNEILYLALTTSGYISYSSLPKWVGGSGIDKFFPQAMGMLVFSLIISLFLKKRVLVNKYSYYNIFSGLVFSIAASFYLISINLNSLVTAFTLSQMNVVIASLCGIFLLHEKKSANEFISLILGLFLVVAGGIIVISI